MCFSGCQYFASSHSVQFFSPHAQAQHGSGSYSIAGDGRGWNLEQSISLILRRRQRCERDLTYGKTLIIHLISFKLGFLVLVLQGKHLTKRFYETVIAMVWPGPVCRNKTRS